MGRQIRFVATQIDEAAFLAFVRETADIVLLESFAPTQEALWCDAFAAEPKGHSTYAIWNRAFAWTPDYAQFGVRAVNPGHVGWHHVSNVANAPLVEFTRARLQPLREGRLDWAKDSSAPDGLAYDVPAFTAWYDSLHKWVRKNGKRPGVEKSEPWYLPDAWARRGALG